MEFSKKDEEAVKWCEDNYKNLTDEYKKIMMEQYILFCKKHRNYGTGNDSIQSIGTGAGGMRFYTAGAVDFAMTDSGDFHADGDIIGYSSTISDIKFKENVRPIENALLKVQKLRGVEFDWKDDFNERGHDVGFIAQEVEKVDGLEVLVKEGYLLNDDDEELTGKRVYYEKVVPLLVEAIKEQQIQIKELQSKVEKLDGNNK